MATPRMQPSAPSPRPPSSRPTRPGQGLRVVGTPSLSTPSTAIKRSDSADWWETPTADTKTIQVASGLKWSLHRARQLVREKLMGRTRTGNHYQTIVHDVFGGYPIITADVFKQKLAHLGLVFNEAQAAQLFASFDTTGTGELPVQELVYAVAGRDYKSSWQPIGEQAHQAPVVMRQYPVPEPPPIAATISDADTLFQVVHDRLMQQFKDDSAAIVSSARVFGKEERSRLLPSEFAGRLNRWLNLGLSEQQAHTLATRLQVIDEAGRVNTLLFMQRLLRGLRGPEYREPIKKLGHHAVTMPVLQFVPRIEQLIREKVEQHTTSSQVPAAVVIDAFNRLDRSCSGLITQVVFKQGLSKFGVQLADSDWTRLIAHQLSCQGQVIGKSPLPPASPRVSPRRVVPGTVPDWFEGESPDFSEWSRQVMMKRTPKHATASPVPSVLDAGAEIDYFAFVTRVLGNPGQSPRYGPVLPPAPNPATSSDTTASAAMSIARKATEALRRLEAADRRGNTSPRPMHAPTATAQPELTAAQVSQMLQAAVRVLRRQQMSARKQEIVE